MLRLILVIIVSVCFLQLHAFVLLQVKRVNESVSKIDALIHKTVPNEKIEELKVKLGESGNNKTKLGRKTTFETAQTNNNIVNQTIDDRSMESVVLSGVKNIISEDKSPNLVGNIAKKILDFVYKNAGPILRTGEYDKNVISPNIIKDLEGDQPSMLFQIDGNKVLNELMEALQSNSLHTYVNNFTRRAAKAYHRLQENLEKDNRNLYL